MKMADFYLNDSLFLPEPPGAHVVGGLDLTQLSDGKPITFEVSKDIEEVGVEDWEFSDYSGNGEDGNYYDFVTKRDKRFVGLDQTFEELEAKMKNVDDHGLVKKEIIKPGRGAPMKGGSTVIIHYQMFLEGVDEPFDSTRLRNRRFTVQLGNSHMIPGLELAIMSMQVKELARFIISWRLAYGSIGAPPRIPPEQDILVELELLDVLEGRDVDPSSPDAEFKIGMRQAKTFRIIGSESYKRGQIKEAVRNYNKAKEILEHLKLADADDEAAMTQVKVKTLINLAICHNQLNRPEKACIHCRTALSFEPNNPKALFQFGRAKLSLGDYKVAADLLNRAHKLEPTNKQVLEELKKLDDKQTRARKQEEDFCKRFLGLNTSSSSVTHRGAENHNTALKAIIMEKIDLGMRGFSIRGNLNEAEKNLCKQLAKEFNFKTAFSMEEATFYRD